MIGILAIVVAAGAAYMFQSEPLNEAVAQNKQLEAIQKGKQNDIRALTEASSSLSEKENELTSYGVSPESLASVMPATEDISGLYLLMEALNQNAGTFVTKPSYTISTPVVDEIGSVKIPVSITASGSYSSLKRLLTTYEHATRPVSFVSVNLAPPAEGVAASNFTLSASGFVAASALSPAYAQDDSSASTVN